MTSVRGKNIHRLKHCHITVCPRQAVKSILILGDFQQSTGKCSKQSDLTLKLVWLSCPLWPKLLWLLNQLPLDEGLCHQYVPPRHTDPGLVASWSVQAKACKPHRLSGGARCGEPRFQMWLSASENSGQASWSRQECWTICLQQMILIFWTQISSLWQGAWLEWCQTVQWSETWAADGNVSSRHCHFSNTSSCR